MKTEDKLTPELRQIEKEIDNYYKSNPLVNLPFATAAWYLLATVEDIMVTADLYLLTPQDRAMVVDNFVNELKYPMYWLFLDCAHGGQVPFAYNEDSYQASYDLLKLGKTYGFFDSAFTYASCEWIEIALHRSTIQPTKELFVDMEYNAYNLLIKPQNSLETLSSLNKDNLLLLKDVIGRSLKVQGDRFNYKLNPKIVADTKTVFSSPILDSIFLLPREWKFSHYSLGDFREVFEAIFSMAFIHAVARGIAVTEGCLGRGHADGIYVLTRGELLRRVVRYSGVSESKVLSIFDDLSYGNRGISKPDPALQPLIKLNSEVYVIVPHLWLSCSSERNFTVLLNKLSSEKEIYSRLIAEKEGLTRQRLTSHLPVPSFRFSSGRVQDLPDVDLAIVSDVEKACLLLELKWFIEPAEVREIIHRSKEIEKGISQVVKLNQAFANNHKPLMEKMKIDSSYRLEGVVVSENWIGHANVQSSEIPVIQADHLIAKLKATESLLSTIEWLKARKYLPKEGEHFKINKATSTIGSWSVDWYEIESLIGEPFFPL